MRDQNRTAVTPKGFGAVRSGFLPAARRPDGLSRFCVATTRRGKAHITTRRTHGPALTRADVARLAQVAGAALSGGPPEDEKKQTIARALAEVGQTRTWNLMIDVIAQTGNYVAGTPNLNDPTKFIVQGEKRYWLHVALDREDGTVLGTQLEEVIE